MSALIAAYAAVGFSLFSLIILFMSMPKLTGVISDIGVQLVKDVEEFRALENDIWEVYRDKVR